MGSVGQSVVGTGSPRWWLWKSQWHREVGFFVLVLFLAHGFRALYSRRADGVLRRQSRSEMQSVGSSAALAQGGAGGAAVAPPPRWVTVWWGCGGLGGRIERPPGAYMPFRSHRSSPERLLPPKWH